jgi:metal-responsive CopG/Arc/MetJ family transcriptional regulator
MAHVRSDSKYMSTTISIDEHLLLKIEDYRFSKRKNNRSAAIAELILKGLKYEELVQKRKSRNAI